MSGPFDTDFATLGDLFAEAFGATVTIARGSKSTGSVTAEAYVNEYTVETEDGLVTSLAVRDYVISVADYTISGAAVQPRRGDRITETISGTEYTFEVMPLASMPASQWTDTDASRWLIHTKRVG